MILQILDLGDADIFSHPRSTPLHPLENMETLVAGIDAPLAGGASQGIGEVFPESAVPGAGQTRVAASVDELRERVEL